MTLEDLLPIAFFLLFVLISWLGAALGRGRDRRQGRPARTVEPIDGGRGRGPPRAAPRTSARGEAPPRIAVPLRDEVPLRGEAPPRIEAPLRGEAPSRIEAPPRIEAPLHGEAPPRIEAPLRGEAPSRIEASREDGVDRRARPVAVARRSAPLRTALRRRHRLREAFVLMEILDRRLDRWS